MKVMVHNLCGMHLSGQVREPTCTTKNPQHLGIQLMTAAELIGSVTMRLVNGKENLYVCEFGF